MKYIKKIESKNFNIDAIRGEIDTLKQIGKFFKKHNLERVEVDLGKKILRVYHDESLDFVGGIYQIIDGEKEELAVGIKRYKVPNLLKKILTYLNNMSDRDWIRFYSTNKEDVLAFINTEKYNL